MITQERRQAALDAANSQGRASLGARLAWAVLRSFKSAIIALAIFSVLRTFVIEAFKIPSGSMERTLMIGDFLLVNKIGYAADIPFSTIHTPAFREPKIGQVIVFQWPEDRSKNFVKRIVGVPGDTLEMHNGMLMRNGLEQQERYAQHQRWSGGGDGGGGEWQLKNNWGPVVIPEHNYFVLGDNRDNSLDSRYWGFVPDSLVRGSPLVVYYSYDAALQDSPKVETQERPSWFSWLTRIRWRRFGEMIQ